MTNRLAFAVLAAATVLEAEVLLGEASVVAFGAVDEVVCAALVVEALLAVLVELAPQAASSALLANAAEPTNSLRAPRRVTTGERTSRSDNIASESFLVR
ncbi:MAG: hypothetical protein M1298_02210 [Chloroflexi bacterium]|nr:hypothetical protein [Chloroflexota bacterium]